ncbi:hypothetical protein ACVWZ6_000444 [Bradyrhizobium sp. GM6.1]
MEQEFYRGLAQRVRGMAEKADPFTRRRLLDLAKRYDYKGGAAGPGGTERPLPGAAHDAAYVELLRTRRGLTRTPLSFSTVEHGRLAAGAEESPPTEPPDNQARVPSRWFWPYQRGFEAVSGCGSHSALNASLAA